MLLGILLHFVSVTCGVVRSEGDDTFQDCDDDDSDTSSLLSIEWIIPSSALPGTPTASISSDDLDVNGGGLLLGSERLMVTPQARYRGRSASPVRVNFGTATSS